MYKSKCRLKENLFGRLHSPSGTGKQVWLFICKHWHEPAMYVIQLALFSKAPYSAKEGQAVGLFISPLLWYVCSVLYGDNAPQKKKRKEKEVHGQIYHSVRIKVAQIQINKLMTGPWVNITESTNPWVLHYLYLQLLWLSETVFWFFFHIFKYLCQHWIWKHCFICHS